MFNGVAMFNYNLTYTIVGRKKTNLVKRGGKTISIIPGTLVDLDLVGFGSLRAD